MTATGRRQVTPERAQAALAGPHDTEPDGGSDTPSTKHERDWSSLMAAAQTGDGGAYHRLLTAVTPHLRGRAKRHFREPNDAEDAVQDVLLALHAARHTYDPSRPFGPWLRAITERRLMDRLRRQYRRRARETPLPEDHETFADDTANLPDSEPDHRRLAAAVARLPAGQREAIRLLKLEELSLNEAANLSGMTPAALKVATHRALKRLRATLG